MNDDVFNRLYDSYHQDVFRFLIYLVNNRSVAEDLSHEVYVRVLKSYGGFERKSSEKTWIFSIAKNVAIDHFRKSAVRKKHHFASFDWEREQLISNEKLPEEVLQLSEDHHYLLVALAECTGDQRLVITLRYFQDLTIAETARILEWTEAKVKTTQHRAIKALRGYMLQYAEKGAN